MKSVARRVVDRHMLHLIKMWLVVPVEETDDRKGRQQTSAQPTPPRHFSTLHHGWNAALTAPEASMTETLNAEKNVLGTELLPCSYAPLTGYFRDGCCARRATEGVAHLVCVKVSAEFLEFSKARGNDLSTPRLEMRFRGLREGDRWCLHVLRWIEAWEAGRAPKVVLEATNRAVLKLVPLSALKRHALDAG